MGTEVCGRGMLYMCISRKKKVIHPFVKQYTVLIQVDTMIWKAMKPN